MTETIENHRFGAAALSLLSGNPDAQDKQHHHVRTLIDNARYAPSTQAFSIDCNRVEEGKDPYQTTWIKSPHGVYVFTRTEVPINIKGDIQTAPGYAVLFSQHPSFLAKLLLSKEDVKYQPSLEEIEAKISVVSARYHHDILQKNRVSNQEHIVTSWVKTSIDRHTSTFSRLLKRHGSIIQDGENIFRSGSSVLWLEPTKDDPNLFECYYYGNPIFGQTSLFMNEKTIQSPLSNYLLKKAAIKLGDTPLNKEAAHKFAHQEFAKIARSVIRNEDPYDLDCPTSWRGKGERFFKKTILRTFQKLTHSTANMNKKAFVITAAVSGALVAVTQLPLLFAAATTSARTGMIMKGGQSVARAFSKFLSPINTISVNALNDISTMLGSFIPNNYVSDETRGLILNPKYIQYMNVVPVQFMGNTFPETKSYNKDESQQWAQSVLLDTLGIQPGTIFSEQEINDRHFLMAEQPNGLNVYYDPEELVAFAHRVREPFEHSCLEQPIAELLESLPPHHEFIGVRCNPDGKIVKTSFTSLDDIPEELVGNRESSIEYLKNIGLDLNNLGVKKRFNILNAVPDGEAKSIKKKAEKELTAYLKNAFKTGAVLDASSPVPETIDGNIALLYRSKDVVSAYFQRLANPVTDEKQIQILHSVENFALTIMG